VADELPEALLSVVVVSGAEVFEFVVFAELLETPEFVVVVEFEAVESVVAELVEVPEVVVEAVEFVVLAVWLDVPESVVVLF
jgi:hypothetical protein